MNVTLCDVCGSIAQAKVEDAERLAEIGQLDESPPKWWDRLFGHKAAASEPIPATTVPNLPLNRIDLCYSCLRKFQTWVTTKCGRAES